jgi:hypothetical protein
MVVSVDQWIKCRKFCTSEKNVAIEYAHTNDTAANHGLGQAQKNHERTEPGTLRHKASVTIRTPRIAPNIVSEA